MSRVRVPLFHQVKALNGVKSDRSDPATIRTLLLGVSASNQSLDLTGLKGVGKKSEVEQVRTRRYGEGLHAG